MSSWLRLLSLHKFQVLAILTATVVGGVALLFCYQFVVHESTYDRWHPDLSQIVRVELLITPPGGEPMSAAATSRGLAPWVRDLAVGEVESITSFTQLQVTVYVDGRAVSELATFVDGHFRDVVPLPWLHAPATARQSANEIHVSADLAKTLFGSTDAIGRTLVVPNIGAETFVVAGIFELPTRTHWNFGMLLPRDPAELEPTRSIEDWLGISDYAYARLSAPESAAVLAERLAATMDQHIDSVAVGGEVLKPSSIWSFRTVPVHGIHLDSHSQGQFKAGGDRRTLGVLGILAVCIAIVALSNFANYAFLLNAHRARELAIARLAGEGRWRQAGRVTLEFAVLALLALALAALLARAFGAEMVSLLNLGMAWSTEASNDLLGWSVSLSLVFALLCGAVAALGIVSRGTGWLLRSGLSGGSGGIGFRTVLFCVQMLLAVALAITCVTVWLQLARLQDVSTGMTINDRLVLLDGGLHHNFNDQLGTIQAQLESTASVQRAAFASDLPGNAPTSYFGVVLGDQRSSVPVMTSRLSVSAGFAEVLGIGRRAGRFFEEGNRSDVYHAYGQSPSKIARTVINASLASALGFASPDEVIGRRIVADDGELFLEVVGVTEDFRYAGILAEVGPVAMVIDEPAFHHALVSLEPGHGTSAHAGVERTLRDLMPDSGLRLEPLATGWRTQFSRLSTLAWVSTLLFSASLLLIVAGVVSFTTVIVTAGARLAILLRLYGATLSQSALEIVWKPFALGACAAMIGALGAGWWLAGWSQQFAERASVAAVAVGSLAAMLALVFVCMLVTCVIQLKLLPTRKLLTSE